MANLAAVVLAKVVVLSGVVLKVVVQVQVARVVKVAARVAKAKTVIRARKSIMGSLLSLRQALKAREMALNGGRQKGVNLSIKALENQEIQAKASDFYRFSSKSAIILVLQQFAAVLSCYRLMLRST